MRGSIKLNGKDVGLVANAASPLIFKQLFHEDFLSEVNGADTGKCVELFQKMAFVMIKQAEIIDIKSLMELSIDDYYAWLVELEPMEIVSNIKEIKKVYFGNTIKNSHPKKRAD